MARLFLAIELPVPVQKTIAGVQNEVKQQFLHSRITWVDPTNFHITLHFLGEIEDGRVPSLINAFKMISYPPPFEIRLTDVHAFPNSKKPQTIFVGTTMPTEAVGVRKRTADILVSFSIPIDGRPWRSHTTIGRVRVQSECLQPDVVTIPPASCVIGACTLMQSVLTPMGSVYNRLAEFQFKGV